MQHVTIPVRGQYQNCIQKGCKSRFIPKTEDQVRCDVCLRMIRYGLEKETTKEQET